MSSRIAGWDITTPLAAGRFDLRVIVHDDAEIAESMRLCDAIGDGLRRAGFQPTITVRTELLTAR